LWSMIILIGEISEGPVEISSELLLSGLMLKGEGPAAVRHDDAVLETGKI
jgi:hypothetical protein